MCGRFAQATPLPKVALKFEAVLDSSLSPRYNVAPQQKAAVLRFDPRKGIRRLEDMTWGLIPAWAAKKKDPHPLINARAETLAEKPSFKESFRKKRCLVPVDGFYEWSRKPVQSPSAAGGEVKQPFYFTLKGGEPFVLAGLWESFEKDGEPDATFTIVTTEANGLMRPVHDRMPVILDPNHVAAWLDPNLTDAAVLQRYLKPHDPDRMESRPVSTYVSNAKNEGPDCIKPL